MITFDEPIKEIITSFMKDAPSLKLTIGTIFHGKKEYVVYDQSGVSVNNQDNLFFYEIGSLTQTFTSLLIAKLIEENRLNLADRLNKFVDNLPSNHIYPTIKSLLTHTSGYPHDANQRKIINRLFWYGSLKTNPYQKITNNDILKKIRKINLHDKIYSYNYSYFGYASLALVIEKVMGMPFNEALENFIHNDLHLYATTFNNEAITDETKLNKSLILEGHVRRQNVPFNWSFDTSSWYQGATGLTSNINDLLEYCFLIMTNAKNYMTLTKEKLTRIDEVSNMSCGWSLIIGDSMMSKRGMTNGFDASIIMSPNLQTATIVLANYGSENDKGKESLASSETLSYRIMNAMLKRIIDQMKGAN